MVRIGQTVVLDVRMGGIKLLEVFLDYTQSLATIQENGPTELCEALSSPFAHLHESFLY